MPWPGTKPEHFTFINLSPGYQVVKQKTHVIRTL